MLSLQETAAETNGPTHGTFATLSNTWRRRETLSSVYCHIIGRGRAVAHVTGPRKEQDQAVVAHLSLRHVRSSAPGNTS